MAGAAVTPRRRPALPAAASLGPWILDFYCAEARLAVEVDGESHAMGDPAYDDRRDADLRRRGVRVLRFAATDVLQEIDGVLGMIFAEAGVTPPSQPDHHQAE